VSEDDKKKQLAQLYGLMDSSVSFESDLTQIIGRDKDGKLLCVGVLARGAEARALEKYLLRRDRKP
jgi:hypothetical protein